MAIHTQCEKGSCLYKLRKTMILREDMCSVCKEMEGRSTTYFKNHNMEIKGVCHSLHPHLASQQNATDNETDTDKENRPQQNPVRMERFDACPANGSHQLRLNRKDAGRKIMNIRDLRRSKAHDVVANLKKTSRCRRSLLASLSGNENASVPRNGTSRSAKYKAKTIMRDFISNSIGNVLPSNMSKKERLEVYKMTNESMKKYIEKLEENITPEPNRKKQSSILAPIPKQLDSKLSSDDSPVPLPGGTVKKRKRDDVLQSSNSILFSGYEGVFSPQRQQPTTNVSFRKSHPQKQQVRLFFFFCCFSISVLCAIPFLKLIFLLHMIFFLFFCLGYI